MPPEFRLFIQVSDRHLRLVPLGTLTTQGVQHILGAAQAGLQAFPVVVVDLQEAGEVPEGLLPRLEEGLRQLVAAKRLILGLETERWTLQPPPPKTCRCQGDCQNCPCQSQGDKKNVKRIPA
ncbi:MAG: hypothetical protein FJ135_07025 [Deltaproteobacteria bacterium]|nr:hypothetical protein [Deltaproteobacteria bacterium]